MRAWYVWRERRLIDVYTVPCRRVSRCERSDSVQAVPRWCLLRGWCGDPGLVCCRQLPRYKWGHITGRLHRVPKRHLLHFGRHGAIAVRPRERRPPRSDGLV